MSDETKVLEALGVKLDKVEAAILKETGVRELEIVESRRKAKRATGFAFVAGIVGLLGIFGAYRANQAIDDVIAARSQSRAGLCAAIDDMRAKHNHFVDSVIAERQQIIDQTEASTTATDDQKAASKAFFEGQIEQYRSDLLSVIDCNDPAALASLFSKPTGG